MSEEEFTELAKRIAKEVFGPLNPLDLVFARRIRDELAKQTHDAEITLAHKYDIRDLDHYRSERNWLYGQLEIVAAPRTKETPFSKRVIGFLPGYPLPPSAQERAASLMAVEILSKREKGTTDEQS